MLGRLSTIFPKANKPLIAMAHVPALPGTPLYDSRGRPRSGDPQVAADVDILLGAGFDSVMFCNENDRPYQLNAGLEAAAFMTRVVTECRTEGSPSGWTTCGTPVARWRSAPPRCLVRTGVAAGAWESDMGLWQTDARQCSRERRRSKSTTMAILMNVTPDSPRRSASQPGPDRPVGRRLEHPGRDIDLGPDGRRRAGALRARGRLPGRLERRSRTSQHRGQGGHDRPLPRDGRWMHRRQ